VKKSGDTGSSDIPPKKISSQEIEQAGWLFRFLIPILFQFNPLPALRATLSRQREREKTRIFRELSPLSHCGKGARGRGSANPEIGNRMIGNDVEIAASFPLRVILGLSKDDVHLFDHPGRLRPPPLQPPHLPLASTSPGEGNWRGNNTSPGYKIPLPWRGARL